MSAETPPTGSAPATPAAAQVAATPPAPDPQTGPAQPSTVTIPLETLQSFTAIQQRLAQLETDNKIREQQIQQEQAAILAKSGDIEKAFALSRQQAEKDLATSPTWP